MKRKRKRVNSGLGVVVLTVLILFSVISYSKMGLEKKKEALYEEKEKYEKQLEDLREETEEIDEYREYIKSNEYIESIAREKLGLVYPNDIIFEPDGE